RAFLGDLVGVLDHPPELVAALAAQAVAGRDGLVVGLQAIQVLDLIDLARGEELAQRGAGGAGADGGVGARGARGAHPPGRRRQIGRRHGGIVDGSLVAGALVEQKHPPGEGGGGEGKECEGGEDPRAGAVIQAHRGNGTLASASHRRLQEALQASKRNTFVRTPIRLSLLFLALLVAPVLLVAGCGGGSGENPQKVLKETFSGNKKVTSGKLDLALTVTADGVSQLKGPITVGLTGPFQSQGSGQLPKFDFDLKLGAQGQNFTAGAISTGDKGYIKLQGNTYEVSSQLFNSFKQGFERSQSQQNGTKTNPSFA